MTITPEKEKPVQAPELPPDEKNPLVIERKEGQPTSVFSQPPTQVATDDQKQPVVAPQPPSPSLTLPSDQAQLTTSSQGSPDDALTWFAAFWLRMIKKAIHLGWRIVGKI